MDNFQTEQEKFWLGKFGDEYVARNRGNQLIASNLSLFSRILQQTGQIENVIEFGANIGLNIMALQQLLPMANFSAVEINERAVRELEKIEKLTVYHDSILNFSLQDQMDFVLTKGVLIHIAPDDLTKVYDLLYRTSRKYICLVEYYNPTPIQVDYHGNKEKLFKRDFAGDLMKRYPDLKLKNYGFIYHNDNHFPQDDLTWFLLEK